MRKILQTEDFVLGTFASNCSGGMMVTKLLERWAATWENNDQLGRILDDAGIDFMLPIARWIGYGGETDFHGTVLETMTWATALLAQTKQITVFATIHVAANHPVVVAKKAIGDRRRDQLRPRRPQHRRRLEQAGIRGARTNVAR